MTETLMDLLKKLAEKNRCLKTTNGMELCGQPSKWNAMALDQSETPEE